MKYKLTDETIDFKGIILHRIECIASFGKVRAGEKGGFVKSEKNLSQDGNAWVYDNAWVYGDAWVYGNAKVYGNAEVYGNALVHGNAKVYGCAEVYGNVGVFDNAKVYGCAEVFGNALVYDKAKVYGCADIYGDTELCGNAEVSDIDDYIIFKNHWSSGRFFTCRFFTWTKSNNMWRVGCFYGSGEELVKKAYEDSQESGRFYEAYVNFVKQLQKIENDNETNQQKGKSNEKQGEQKPAWSEEINEGYVNLYRDENGVFCGASIHQTEKGAINEGQCLSDSTQSYVKTIKIEY